ncbi:peptidase S24/S26A/S26B/S26C [Lipomyces chichibuensis]|uniref:peptidase S24/S26A/S26B/S26C n=1 Tax=Lipomyces chichibuensis TaxID=1546026 RepID=UPI0033436961
MATRGFRYYTTNASKFVRAVAAVHLLHTYVLEFAITGGLSMLPTLHTVGDHVFLDKYNHRLGREIKVGDVIVISKPTEEHTRICKRVAGLPGDIVYCDAMPKAPMRSAGMPDDLVGLSTGMTNGRTGKYIKVPEGHIWILGDNSMASLDSREYGPVPKALVVGKVLWAVYWGPFNWLPGWPRRIGSNIEATDLSVTDFLPTTQSRK